MSTPKKKPNNQVKNNSAKPAAKKSFSELVDWKETAKITAILTAICLIIALALAGTNMLTKDIIAQAEADAKAAACRQVIPAEDYVVLSDYFDGFERYDVNLAVSGGRVVGAAITTASKGYGGTVSVMTGIDENGCVKGVSVLSHAETPGLGANAAKPAFLEQFVTGEESPRPTSFAVSKDGGEIDAVTSATITSRAISNAVNDALGIYSALERGGIIGAEISIGTASASDAPASGTDAPASNADAAAANLTGGENNG